MSLQQELIKSYKNEMTSSLGISLFAHVAIFCFLTFKTVFFPSQPIEIPNAIHVDLVGLPDKVQPQKVIGTPTPQKAIQKPKKKSKKKINLKKKNLKSKQKDALKKLKSQKAIDRIRNQLKNQQTQRAAIKGNQVTKGNALTGLDKIEHQEYFSRLKPHLYQYWSLPQWLSSGNFKAAIQVLIDERGYVIQKKLITPSGNEIFDARVLEAISKASPFPPPPKRLRNLLASEGIVFRFPE